MCGSWVNSVGRSIQCVHRRDFLVDAADHFAFYFLCQPDSTPPACVLQSRGVFGNHLGANPWLIRTVPARNHQRQCR